MKDTGSRSVSDQIIRKSTALENLDVCPNEIEQLSTRFVSSPKEPNCQISSDLMVCTESTSHVYENSLAHSHAQTSKTKWKRLTRSKGKAHSMNLQFTDTNRSFDLIDVKESDIGIGKKLVRNLKPYCFSTASATAVAAEQQCRSP